MRKYLYLFIGIISLLGVSKVKADTLSISSYYIDSTYNISLSSYGSLINDYSSVISTLYENIYNEYIENYQENYPYYFIYIKFPSFSNSSLNDIELSLFAFSDIVQISYTNISNDSSYKDMMLTFSDLTLLSSNDFIGLQLSYKDDTYISPYTSANGALSLANDQINIISSYVSFANIFYTNFDFKYVLENDSDKIVINNNPFGNNDLIINNGDNVLQMQNLLDLNIIHDPEENQTEINLNNYSYVALSLKDYTERDEFYTNVYVKGNYCITSVYNYGLTERKDVISGTKMQSCSPYYDNFTPVKTYILKNDMKNHAIYYLKAYDTSKENKVKVDTSIFNVHYITEDEEDNPILNINGRNYTPIPYSDLTDTATISEEEGYVSGVTCGVGDFNCISENNGNFTFSDIFTKPLEILKGVWQSIVSVFTLVTSLISVLPEPMQYFLYASFMLAIVLGLIKIIL